MNDQQQELALKCYDEGITPEEYKRFYEDQQYRERRASLTEKQKHSRRVGNAVVFSIFLLLAVPLFVAGFFETWFGYTPDWVWVCYDFIPTLDVNGTEPIIRDGECHFDNGLFLLVGGIAVPVGIVLTLLYLVVLQIQKIVERRK